MTGHSLKHCFKADPDGFLSGCPRCDDFRHDYDQCHQIKQPRDDLLFLVKHRNNKPLIRSQIDIRTLEGFYDEENNAQWIPWTPDFTKEFMTERPEYYKEHKFKANWQDEEHIEDPAWGASNWGSNWPAGYLAYTYPNGPVEPDPVKLRQAYDEYHDKSKKPYGRPSSFDAPSNRTTHFSYGHHSVSNANHATPNFGHHPQHAAPSGSNMFPPPIGSPNRYSSDPYVAARHFGHPDPYAVVSNRSIPFPHSHRNPPAAPSLTPADIFLEDLLQPSPEHRSEALEQRRSSLSLASDSTKRQGSSFPDSLKSQETGAGHYPATSTAESSKKRKMISDKDETDQHPSKRTSRPLQCNKHTDDAPTNLLGNVKSKCIEEETISDDPPNIWGKITRKFMKR
jgi:hypothetical protein